MDSLAARSCPSHCSILTQFSVKGMPSCCINGPHALQELGLENAWISELIFTSLFVAFILWTFSPFVFLKKRFYTTLLYSQLLSVLVGEASSLLL